MGKSFVLLKDNRAVQLIFASTSMRPPARIERMALRLSQFDYIIVHRPGATNIADYYSIHPNKGPGTAFLEEVRTEPYINAIARDALPNALNLSEVINTTKEDKNLYEIMRFVRNNTNVRFSPSYLIPYKQVFDELNVTETGILLRGQCIVIPHVLRGRVVELAHEGYQGIVKTKSLMRSRIWFPGIDKMVEERIQNCRECQAYVDSKSYEPMRHAIRSIAKRFRRFFGPMKDGTYWFVNYCEYSRWASVDNIKAVSIDQVQPRLEQLFGLLGTPLEYKTDNGFPFQSSRFADFSRKLGFKHKKITPYWPRANSGVDSFMKKLCKVLRSSEIAKEDKKEAVKKFLLFR